MTRNMSSKQWIVCFVMLLSAAIAYSQLSDTVIFEGDNVADYEEDTIISIKTDPPGCLPYYGSNADCPERLHFIFEVSGDHTAEVRYVD